MLQARHSKMFLPLWKTQNVMYESFEAEPQINTLRMKAIQSKTAKRFPWIHKRELISLLRIHGNVCRLAAGNVYFGAPIFRYVYICCRICIICQPHNHRGTRQDAYFTLNLPLKYGRGLPSLLLVQVCDALASYYHIWFLNSKRSPRPRYLS